MTRDTEAEGRLRTHEARFAPAVMLIFVLCLLPEAAFTAADLGLWASPRLRTYAIEYGAFWSGLLFDWTPNYALQPYAMFLTYGFLHAGFLHFALNMLTLFSLAPICIRRIGQWRFLWLYLAAMTGGALGFAALAHEAAPMVGASGALFGLAGAILSWEWTIRRSEGEPVWPVWRGLGLLVLLNIALWWAMDGLLAWQTHLGGFVVGWFAAIVADRRGPRDSTAR